jgi:hypothetical protein
LELIIVAASLTSDAQCTIAGNADIAHFNYPVQTIKYTTMDPNSHPGRVVAVNQNGIVGNFRIQSVDITHVGEYANSYPFYDVTASSSKFTYQDFLFNTQLQ